MYRFWGKTYQNKIHLLVYHLLDVMSVADIWLKNSSILRKKFTTLSGLEEDKISYLIPFLASLHDIGKFSYGFQKKSIDALKKLNTPYSEVTGNSFDHGLFGTFWLNEYCKEHKASTIIPGYVERQEDIWKVLFLSAGIHHGNITTMKSLEEEQNLFIMMNLILN